MKIQNLFRAIQKNKTGLATNIIGLSIGLATTILLVIFILNEWSYDRHFAKADQIYRLNSIRNEAGNSTTYPINLRQAYTEIPEKVPGIEAAVQIYRGWDVELSFNQTRFANNQLFYVDSTFFKVFHFNPVEGSIENSLDNPNSIVLTKKLASKIFGNNSAVGQMLFIDGKSYTVSAVTENVPNNTHFNFDLLIPMKSINILQWIDGLEFFTYYRYSQNTDPQQISNAICAANTNLLKNRFTGSNYGFSSEVEPLKRIHLYSISDFDLGPQGSIKTVILVGIIAFLVMFLALTNFVNLFIVEGEQRSKEIGVRKVNGAGKTNLIRQFFAETTLIVTLAFLMGLVLVILLLPEFGKLMQREFSSSLIKSPVFFLSLAGVFLITIFLSGSYPAFYLSSLKPASILKSQSGNKNRKKIVMNLAGGMQLVVTLFLLTVLFGINAQIHFLKNQSPGFNPNGLVNISHLNDNIREHYASIRDKLLDIPEITGVSSSDHRIGGGCSGQGIRLAEDAPEKWKIINEYRVQPGFCDLLGIQLSDGRFFDPERPLDKNTLIINEAALKLLGLESAVGHKAIMFDKPMEIIGVVKNFNYESAANVVQPLVITCYGKHIENITVRIAEHSNPAQVMQKVAGVLHSFDSGYIVSSKLVSDTYNEYYKGEERISQLTKMGAVLAVVIVMMGIFMLVSQSIVRRTKEIGIRKVLGGTTTKMLALIYSNSLKWTGIAAVIAIPLSYFMLQNWLQNYAVKAPLGWWLFIQGIIIILILETVITIGQTWRAATRNPVESLRYE